MSFDGYKVLKPFDGRELIKRERSLAAFHEAGHAVAAWQLGLDTRYAEIGPEPTTRFALPKPGDAPERILPAIIALMAGPIAERVYGRGQSKGDMESDIFRSPPAAHDARAIRKLARGLSRSKAERDVFLRASYRRTCQIVTEEGRNIRRVAKELLTNGQIGMGGFDTAIKCMRMLKIKQHRARRVSIVCRRLTRAEYYGHR